MKTFTHYAITPPASILEEQQSSIAHGLSNAQVRQRAKQNGHNSFNQGSSHFWRILKRQTKDPMLYLMIVSAIISFLLQEYLTGIMICILTFISVSLGVYQEYFAEKTVMLLNKLVSFHVHVLRNGHTTEILSEDLVPGDIVLLEAGSLLAADIRLLETENLIADESMLTGESNPIHKLAETLAEAPSLFNATNIGFAGTTITSGKGIGIVLKTGTQSTLGSMAELPPQPSRKNAFTQGIENLTFFIIVFVISVISIIFGANYVCKGSSFNIWQMLIFSITLAITIIPEALNVIISFSLSLGARLLAKKKVIVKKLSSIDDLGSIEVLCTDKTGTITTNELTVTDAVSFNNADTKIIAQHAAQCSISLETNEASHEPFDIALEHYCITNEINIRESISFIARIPFDPSRKRAVTMLNIENKKLLVVRGAYEELIKRCTNLTDALKQQYQTWIKEHEEEGTRVLAVAQKQLPANTDEIPVEEQDLEMLGLIAFADKLKDTTASSIQRAKNIGITIKILSGDSPEVTKSVARQVGLPSGPDDVITGPIFADMSMPEKKDAATRCTVFARVTPEQKCEIVGMLQEQCDVCFLGEGMNDAKVLKSATVGIAVNNATDVAKAAADIIILENNLGVIIDGIMIGRKVFTNTMKYLLFILTSNFSNFYTLSIASLMLNHLPMLPLQLLFVNLLADIPMTFVATDQVDIAELRRPKNYNFKKLLYTAISLGITCTIFDFAFIATVYHQKPAVMQTNWFIYCIITGFVLFLTLRTKGALLKASPPSLVLGVLITLAAGISVLLPFTSFGKNILQLVHPTMLQLLTIFGISLLNVISIEIIKRIIARLNNEQTVR